MAAMPTSTGRTASEASQHQVVPLAARTAAPSPAVFYFENVGNATGFRLYINSTAASTSSTTVTIAFNDYKANVYFDVLASAAITAAGQVILEVSPSAATVANVSLQRQVGRGVRVTIAHGNSNSHTYSVTAEWLP